MTDEGLKELAGFQSLRTLFLRRTKVTDVGLKKLADHKSLQMLWLDDCFQVTDAGLKELAGQKKLAHTKSSLGGTKGDGMRG